VGAACAPLAAGVACYEAYCMQWWWIGQQQGASAATPRPPGTVVAKSFLGRSKSPQVVRRSSVKFARSFAKPAGPQACHFCLLPSSWG
jgi:hypothetical protein